MARFVIYSRSFGEIKFVAKNDGGYVRVYGSDNGWEGKQPCAGGGFYGSTLIASEKTLEAVARRWWRQWLADQRSFG